jgi:ATP-dependent DNA helicase RecQ
MGSSLEATATVKVQEDIAKGFAILAENCLRTAFFRPNLKLHFTSSSSDKERNSKLIEAIKSKPPGGTIIYYATTQKTTEKVATLLKKAGIDARAYHAGLKNERRKEIQDWFMQEETTCIVVATIAFGMGVDKRDIRYVYHYNLPKSLEGYAQEIGRAGRDGKDSHCEILCCLDDVAKLEAFAFCGKPSLKSIQGVLNDFFLRSDGQMHAVGTEQAVSQYSLGRGNDMEQQAVRMLLAFVDIYHGMIKQGTPRYGVYKVKPRNGGSAYSNPFLLEQCGNPATARILGLCCYPRKTWAHIDIGATVAYDPSVISRDALIGALTRLEQAKLIEISPSQVEHVYRITQVPECLNTLAQEEFDRFQKREQQELARIGQVLAFLTADSCHNRILTEHFEGKDGPSSLSGAPFPCGSCPHCTSGKPLALGKFEGFTINPKLWKQLFGIKRNPGFNQASQGKRPF